MTRRTDRGVPRVLPKGDLDRYLELIAAVKLRTSNRKGRHLSTGEAIRLFEDYGLETPEGRVQAPKGLLKTPTVNRVPEAVGSGLADLAAGAPGGALPSPVQQRVVAV